MSFTDSKVAIVGCGNVGSTTAYTIINLASEEEESLVHSAQMLESFYGELGL